MILGIHALILSIFLLIGYLFATMPTKKKVDRDLND
jgi:hypothetical protein